MIENTNDYKDEKILYAVLTVMIASMFIVIMIG